MKQKKVVIIGNNASGTNISDGGRIKIRLFKKFLNELKIDCEIIDLDKWIFHVFSVIKQIKRAIKDCTSIVIMAGPNGCRAIIPLVNKLNKKKKSRVVFCPLGIGTLDKLVSKLSEEQVVSFLNCENFFGISDKKMGKELEKIDLIALENQLLVKVYKEMYKVNNLVPLYNFREANITKKQYNFGNRLKLIYASRICLNKGIFDLLETIKRLNKKGLNVSLDIYGDNQLGYKENETFNTFLTSNFVSYKGVVSSDKMIETIKNYDLFCLPTKYHGEGMSGALIESFISGTPSLISSYSQAKLLVEDGVTGFIFNIGDVDDLEKKLCYLYDNKAILKDVGEAAQKMSQKYLFSFNKRTFLNCILGEDE